MSRSKDCLLKRTYTRISATMLLHIAHYHHPSHGRGDLEWVTYIISGSTVVTSISPRLSVCVRNAWTILYVAAVFRYQQVTMQQNMKAIDAAGRAKVCIWRLWFSLSSLFSWGWRFSAFLKPTLSTIVETAGASFLTAACQYVWIIGLGAYVPHCQKHERITPITQLNAVDGLRLK